ASHVRHMPLPSCPTRRSSDLARPPDRVRILHVAGELAAGERVAADEATAVADSVGSHGIATAAEVLAGEAHQLIAEVGPGVRLIDRKSTRLNSSHVSISYAVF